MMSPVVEFTMFCDPSPQAVEYVIKTITDGLDAVVIKQVASITHPGCMTLTVTGNGRDVAISESRADKLGRIPPP